MGIYYVKKAVYGSQNQLMDTMFGAFDLINKDGVAFATENLNHRYIGEIGGRFINARIGLSYERILNNYGDSELLKIDEIKRLGDLNDVSARKWILKSKVLQDSHGFYIVFRGENIYLNSKQIIQSLPEKGKYLLQEKISPNSINEFIVVQVSAYYGERYDIEEPLFDAYFNDLQITEISDTPEELLVILAAKEGKTLTLEQAKEIAKDWHFGGVR